MVTSDRMKWFALALLCVTQFIVVLDIAIVNVALPSIQADLGFSQDDLQWVISAYALVFGGFLLLGGRLADIIGRRVVFMAGLVIFSVGSLLCGFAWDDTSLIVARALQGLGAATITPAALSILTTDLHRGARAQHRARRLGCGRRLRRRSRRPRWAGSSPTSLSWEWIFFVNVPVGFAALALSPILLRESKDAHGQSHDIPGAVLVTGRPHHARPRDHAGPAVGLALGEDDRRLRRLRRDARPRSRSGSSVNATHSFRSRSSDCRRSPRRTWPASSWAQRMFSMFLMLTLYMQQVLGYSPIKTGVAYLAVAGTAIIWANVAAVAVNRVGVKPALILGMGLLTAGLVYFTQVSVDGSYWADLFPGFLILGVAIPFAFVPITIAALAGTKPQEAGLASGLINTSQQIGGAVGIAILSTIAVSTTDDAVADGAAVPVALTDGFVNAFWAGAGIALAGLLVSIFIVRGRDLRQRRRSQSRRSRRPPRLRE